VFAAGLAIAILVGAGFGVWLSSRHLHASGGTVYLVPQSIPADGSADVTLKLNSFIASVPSGSETDPSIVRFTLRGRYRIEGRVLVANKRHFVLDGNGATLFATTVGTGSPSQIANRYHLTLRLGSDITVRGLTIVGVNPNPGRFDTDVCCQHGIVVEGTRRALITGNTIRSVYGDNVYVAPYAANYEIGPNDIHIVSNTFIGSGRQGLALVGGSDIWIEHNLIDGSGLSQLDMEPNHPSDSITFVHIVRNTFANNIGAERRGSAISASGAAPVSHVQILGNTVTWASLGITARSPAATSRQTDWLIQGNLVTSTPPSPSAHGYMQFVYMDRVVVDSNTAALDNVLAETTWVVSDASSGVHVTNNTVKNADPFLSCINGSSDCLAFSNRSH
jgi:hypothetical protein